MIDGSYELGRPPGVDELLAALAQAPPRLDLATIAIARLRDARLDPAPVLARLDELSRRVVAHRELGPLDALITVLADEEGFEGDRETYDSPENSWLDRVLERKRGLPILLSVLYLEVGRRAGVPLAGVALPSHFVVRTLGEPATIVDPFYKGRILTRDDCARLVERAMPGTPLTDELLEPATAHAIAWRMVNNLKASFIRRDRMDLALEAVDLLLAMKPGHPAELRARAQLLSKLGAFRAALADVERCLESAAGDDAPELRRFAQELRARIGMLH